MRFAILFLLALFSINSSFASIEAEVKGQDTTRIPNDGWAEVKVKSGKPPYQYKWSNKSTPLTASKSEGLPEGRTFSVWVKDAAGDSVEAQGYIETNSLSEKLNSMFVPVVNNIELVLFWDPFTAVGLYDPVIYTKEYYELAPKARDTSVAVISLEKWLVEDGEKVEKGTPLALLSLDGEADTVFASYSGTIQRNLVEGEELSDRKEFEELRGKDTRLCTIDFSKPMPLRNPNGTIQTKEIPFIVIWLVFGAIFFTIKMNFINFRGVRHALDLVKGKFDKPNDPGEVSHFQALTTALSATVGLGNIAGVAVAITMGGPGATFWMIIAGFIGMTSKFTECALGVKYRDVHEDGSVAGGPMYYLKRGLAKKNWGGMNWGNLGKVLGVLFTILAIGASLGGGNMFQANQAIAQVSGQFEFVEHYKAWAGVVLALLVGIVIIGGIKSIAKVTDKIVPVMVTIYIVFALIIVGMNYDQLGAALGAIFNGAFSASALKGGFIGVLIVGFQRAAFSNEAGIGSAAIAHSAVKTDQPMSEGFVAMLEPFVDTVVVCLMTSLVLIFTGYADGASGLTGSELTSAAFSKEFPWFDFVLMISIVLFAFSTMISWSYYGLKAWMSILGETKISEYSYKLLFLVFIVVGASTELGAVLGFSDMMILGMALPNVLGLLLLSGEVRNDLKEYIRKIKSGEIRKTRE